MFATEIVFAQKKDNSSPSQTMVDTLLFNKMRYRCIGPFRGGRSLAVAGVANKPNTYYFGTVGGGVWKTDNGGNSWYSISDSSFHSSSVGAIAVAPSNSNIIYAGMGEAEMKWLAKAVNTSKGQSTSILTRFTAVISSVTPSPL